MSTFKEDYLKLKEELEALNQRKQSLYSKAVQEVQSIIDEMGIKASDLRFAEEGKKQRAPAKIKYATPDGKITWTGKGAMKKEMEAYMKAHGIKDKEELRVPNGN